MSLSERSISQGVMSDGNLDFSEKRNGYGGSLYHRGHSDNVVKNTLASYREGGTNYANGGPDDGFSDKIYRNTLGKIWDKSSLGGGEDLGTAKVNVVIDGKNYEDIYTFLDDGSIAYKSGHDHSSRLIEPGTNAYDSAVNNVKREDPYVYEQIVGKVTGHPAASVVEESAAQNGPLTNRNTLSNPFQSSLNKPRPQLPQEAPADTYYDTPGGQPEDNRVLSQEAFDESAARHKQVSLDSLPVLNQQQPLVEPGESIEQPVAAPETIAQQEPESTYSAPLPSPLLSQDQFGVEARTPDAVPLTGIALSEEVARRDKARDQMMSVARGRFDEERAQYKKDNPSKFRKNDLDASYPKHLKLRNAPDGGGGLSDMWRGIKSNLGNLETRLDVNDDLPNVSRWLNADEKTLLTQGGPPLDSEADLSAIESEVIADAPTEDEAATTPKQSSSKKGAEWEYQRGPNGEAQTRRKGNKNWITVDPNTKAGMAVERQLGPIDIDIPNSGYQEMASSKPMELPDTLGNVEQGQNGKWNSKFSQAIKGIDKEKAGNTLLDVGTGVLGMLGPLKNMNDLNNMPGLPARRLEQSVDIEAPRFDADRQAIKAQGRTMMNTANQGRPNIAANTSALATTQSALSRLAGVEGNAKIQTDNMNRMNAQGVQSRNIGTLNDYDDQMLSRDLAKMRGMSDQRTAMYENLGRTVGQVSQRHLDQKRMDYNRDALNSYQTMDRYDAAQEEEKKKRKLFGFAS